jgi:hypothetical protein
VKQETTVTDNSYLFLFPCPQPESMFKQWANESSYNDVTSPHMDQAKLHLQGPAYMQKVMLFPALEPF